MVSKSLGFQSNSACFCVYAKVSMNFWYTRYNVICSLIPLQRYSIKNLTTLSGNHVFGAEWKQYVYKLILRQGTVICISSACNHVLLLITNLAILDPCLHPKNVTHDFFVYILTSYLLGSDLLNSENNKWFSSEGWLAKLSWTATFKQRILRSD